MRPRFVLDSGLAALLAGLQQTWCAPSPKSVQVRLEEMSRRYTHFAPEVIIENRELRLVLVRDKTDLVIEQNRLRTELRELSTNRNDMVSLLNHPDPKVRVLALGALFQLEDGRDLPVIAGLLQDQADTLPLLREPRRAGGTPARAEWEQPQKVSDVAQAMLKYWGIGTAGRTVVSSQTFHDYWAKYIGRSYAASWFGIKMNRATRRIVPIQLKFRPDIDRVIGQMDALPLNDRAWIRLFVLCPEGWDPEYIADVRIVPDPALLANARELGPEALLRFLRREPVSHDPDLNPKGRENRDYLRMANFILLHSADLLRPQDADRLLALAESETTEDGRNPAWVIGAAALQPERASALLRSSLGPEAKYYSFNAPAWLAGALWRLGGAGERAFLTDWFYEEQTSGAAEPIPLTEVFLREVRASSRPDTKQLLLALIEHPKFEWTDWPTLKELLLIVNSDRELPLVPPKEIYEGFPNASFDQKHVLLHWRSLLRREFEITERPVVREAPIPRQVLREPEFKTPVEQPIAQLIVSENDQFLATLKAGTVDVWEARTGRHQWTLPRNQVPGQEAWCSWMAFRRPEEHLLLVCHTVGGTALQEWDLVKQQRVNEIPLIGIGDASFAFDRDGDRFGFAGIDDLACFDSNTGRALWVQPGRAGVASSIALSPDGRWLAVGGKNRGPRTLEILDAVNGKSIQILDQFAGRVGALAFTADSAKVAAASAEDGLRLWDVQSGQLEREFDYPPKGKALQIAFSNDGLWLAVSGSPLSLSESRLGLYRLQSGVLEFEIVQPESGLAPCVLAGFAKGRSLLYTVDQVLSAWKLGPP